MARSSSGESVIQRVVRILEQFGPDTTELTLTALAQRADLPIATTHRLVEELVYYGLLVRTDSRSMRVGSRLAEMCRGAHRPTTLPEVARPIMGDLHAVVGHHVLLGMLDERNVVYLEHVHEPADGPSLVGSRVPTYASPCGLVLLAHLPRQQRDRILRGPLEPVSDHTITQPARLRRLLAEVRRTGYAVAPAYAEGTGTGVAAPIRNEWAEVIGALSISVPADHRTQRLIPALLAAARGISRESGMPTGQDGSHLVAPPREHRLAAFT